MAKSPQAFRTISEVAAWLETPAHVLRFWESRFPDIAPVKRAGGRRYYRQEDMLLLGGIKHLLHHEGWSIKAVQEHLSADGAEAVSAVSQPLEQGGTSKPLEPLPEGQETPRPGDGERPAQPIGFFFDDTAPHVDPGPADDAAPQIGAEAQPDDGDRLDDAQQVATPAPAPVAPGDTSTSDPALDELHATALGDHGATNPVDPGAAPLDAAETTALTEGSGAVPLDTDAAVPADTNAAVPADTATTAAIDPGEVVVVDTATGGAGLDPTDDAVTGAPIVPMPAALRAVLPGQVTAAQRRTLSPLVVRLVALRDRLS